MTDSRNPATRLTRSVDEKIFAGVCGGLGEQFGINAWWFRWAFIILTLFGFAGVFFYVLAWILIPKETEDDSVATSWMEGLDLSDVGTIFGVILIGVAGVIVLTSFFNVSGGLVAAGALAIVGVLLYRGDLRPPDRPDKGDKPTPHYIEEDEPLDTDTNSTEGSTPADSPSAGASAVAATVVAEPQQPPKPPKPAKEKKPKPPKSMLGRLTMAVMLIALSTMAIVELANVAHFQPYEYAAVAMGVIAVGLLVGAWVGRAYWLILIGLLIAPFLFFSALLPKVANWSIGDPGHQPTSVEQVASDYDLGIGQLTIDLTELSAEELAEVGRISAEVGLGQLLVRLPADVGAKVDAEVGMGAVTGRNVLGSSTHNMYEFSGVGVEQRFEVGEPPFVLHLDLEVGMGEIAIRRVVQSALDTVGSEG